MTENIHRSDAVVDKIQLYTVETGTLTRYVYPPFPHLKF